MTHHEKPAAEKRSLSDVISNISYTLLRLEPGPLAELRRMQTGSVGPPAFWRMVGSDAAPGEKAATWQSIVRIMAILTPRGERTYKEENGELVLQQKLHGKCPLGKTLCDGGDPSWTPSNPEDRDGLVSIKRLKRLAVTPKAQLPDALERVMRMIAQKRDPETDTNCFQLACLLLEGDNTRTMQRVTYDYYRRLDAPFDRSEKQGTAP